MIKERKEVTLIKRKYLIIVLAIVSVLVASLFLNMVVAFQKTPIIGQQGQWHYVASFNLSISNELSPTFSVEGAMWRVKWNGTQIVGGAFGGAKGFAVQHVNGCLVSSFWIPDATYVLHTGVFYILPPLPSHGIFNLQMVGITVTEGYLSFIVESYHPLDVGGLTIPVDRLTLLAPYIALVSTIILAVSITVAYIKYRKKQ